ncbi:MAG: endolytic transglycosylase MltG, partial [Bacteroidales bacterium]|nr:endolytic transglycosylase MltG [Bacteroidales bacterium]
MSAFYHTKYGRPPEKKKAKIVRIFRNIIILLIVAGSISTYLIYQALWKTNVWIHENTTTSIYIPTGATFNDVKDILYEQGLIINRNSFEWLAKKKKYSGLVKPGRYIIKEKIGNSELINLLRSGMQTP